MTTHRTSRLVEAELTKSIIGGFYAVYRALGFGFLEHVYSAVFERELVRRGHSVGREVLVPIYYCGELAAYQRLDMLVDDRVVIENKTGERLHPIAERQLYNYLRCTNLAIGLLFHFGHEPKFHRVIHTVEYKNPTRAANAGEGPPRLVQPESAQSASPFQSNPPRHAESTPASTPSGPRP
ncbi:MAG TPA: GxxExxY protein [Gemmatimonadaceae bacterium]|nr:GxxExxY protein [Gemmatimonadaceae bacterium]